MKHIIITRFNVKMIDKFRTDVSGNDVESEEWLYHRFQLFEKYCLPSVEKQTNQNFVWVVLFDKLTQISHQERINGYSERCKMFQPHFIDQESASPLNSALFRIIEDNLTSDIKYLITTRLDNDDSINEMMVEYIQDAFDDEECFLNFPHGYQYDELTDETYLIYREKNHFVSRIESISNGFKTVMCCNHIKIDQHGVVYNLVGEEVTPMWVETVHTRNLMNRISPNAIPIRRKYPIDDFH